MRHINPLLASLVFTASGCNLFSDVSPVDGGQGVADARIADASALDLGGQSRDSGPLPSDARVPSDAQRDSSIEDAARDLGMEQADLAQLADTSDTLDATGSSDAMGSSDAATSPDLPVVSVIVPFENQPVGHVVVAEHDFASIPSQAGAPRPIAGTWQLLPSYPQADIAVTSAPAAPLSASSAVAITLPAGMNYGERDWWIEGWTGMYREYREVYLAMSLMLEDIHFEMNGDGVFLGFFSVGIQGMSVERRLELYLSPTPIGAGSAARVRALVTESPTGTIVRELDQNVVPRGTFTAGNWHQIEVSLTNNTLPAADGGLTIWVDGVRVTEYSDVEFQSPVFPGDVGAYVYMQDWRGSAPKSVTDRVLLDHIRITGAP